MLFPAKADQKKGTDFTAVGFFSIFRAATLPVDKDNKDERGVITTCHSQTECVL